MSVQESLGTLDDVVKADVKVGAPRKPAVAGPLQQAVYPKTGGHALLHGGWEALCAGERASRR